MKPVKGTRWAQTGEHVPGVVYLLHCRDTGRLKFGASSNPALRIRTQMSAAKKAGRELRFVWAIITNSIARLEMAWHDRWRFCVEHPAFEWVRLPLSEISGEVSLFRSFSSVIYKDLPPVPDELREAFTGVPKPIKPHKNPKKTTKNKSK